MSAFWINILGYVSLGATLLAGLLVVNLNLKLKLLGVSLYFISNAYNLLLWKYTNLNNFLICSIIFGSLTMINIIRVIHQIKVTNETK